MTIFAIGLLVLQVQLASAGGMVTKPGGNEPLPGATVILLPVNSTPADAGMRPAVTETVTEEDGRFTINGIEPGDYRLLVQSVRYGHAGYGQRKPDGPGAILSIAAGQRIADLRVSMFATGAIAGRVTGPNGEPAAYSTVQAMKSVYQDGKRVLAMAQVATTDDRGEYRLFWLPEGRYVVAASARNTVVNTSALRPLRPGESNRLDAEITQSALSFVMLPTITLLENAAVKRILEDGTVQDESWIPVYYPATTDPARAAPVEVTSGATSNGIDISVGPSRVQKIRGRVLGFSPGSQAPVTLSSGGGGSRGYMASKGASTVDGSFEFVGILPGSYYLSAQDRSGLVASPIAVLVGDRDVENLSIALAPGINLSGRVFLEGVTTSPGGPSPLSGVVIGLRPEIDGTVVRSLTSALLSGNTLTWTNVPPGDYQVSVSQGQRQLHIKSIRLGRTETTGTISLSSGTTDTLEIVLTTETGTVDGVAIGSAGGPAANATVVLVPAAARKRSDLYKTVVTGTDGQFHFQNVAPGDYKLFAWDDVETGAWQNAEFIRQYESRGRAVRVSEKSKADVQLNVIYNP